MTLLSPGKLRLPYPDGSAHGYPKAPDIRTALKTYLVKRGYRTGLSPGTTSYIYMQDAISVSDMTSGFAAYAGYVDGIYANYGQVVSTFPNAQHLSISVFGNAAACLDIEPGDAVPGQAPGFFSQVGHDGALRPWLYCSAGWMTIVQMAMTAAGIARWQYFLWSAHYTGTAHFCGPNTCGFGLSQADATQYAANNTNDTSIVQPYCFSQPGPNPTLSEGASGKAVVTLQTRLNVWSPFGKYVEVKVDGSFGALTLAAVKAFQKYAKLTVDGIVGPLTWAQLNKTPLPPDPAYGAPKVLQAVGITGTASVTLHWDAPGTAGLPAPDHYDVYLYHGTVASEQTLVAGYPQSVKGNSITVSIPFTSKAIPQYSVHVVASGPNGTHIAPDVYADLSFP